MSYIEEIPVELEEAGVVDGCSKLEVLWHIVLPIATPGMVATGIFVFVLAWSEFLYAVIMTSNNTRTLPVAIASFITDRGIEWGEMSAAGSILILPLVVLFYSVQRFLVRGLSFGAIKG
jgi:multiple sugar transport system permease protein